MTLSFVLHRIFHLFQVVGESGLFTPADISFVQDAGVRAVIFDLVPILLS